MSNEISKASATTGIASFMTSDAVRENIESVVGSKDAQKFISSVVSAVQTNPQLAQCTNKSLLSVALLGHSLNLPQSPQMGFFYFVPYKNKQGVYEATFQLSWRGYYQLALRSGQYKKIHVTDVRDGELREYDPLNETIEFNPITDIDERESKAVVGYYATFEMANGFKKFLYWTKKHLEEHAKKYSISYKSDLKYNSNKSLWSTDFDAMARKTMLRLLLSRYGIMSVDLEKAYINDEAVPEEGVPDYVDNKQEDAEVIDVFATPVEEEVVENAEVVEGTPKKGRKGKADER